MIVIIGSIIMLNWGREGRWMFMFHVPSPPLPEGKSRPGPSGGASSQKPNWTKKKQLKKKKQFSSPNFSAFRQKFKFWFDWSIEFIQLLETNFHFQMIQIHQLAVYSMLRCSPIVQRSSGQKVGKLTAIIDTLISWCSAIQLRLYADELVK